MGEGDVSSLDGVWGEEPEEVADVSAFLVRSEAKLDAGFIALEAVDLAVNLVTTLVEVKGQEAFSVKGDGIGEGSAQTRLADVEAQAEDDGVTEDEVHGELGLEARESV